MIPLYVSNGRAFIWNANDWMDLRKNHRIVGELIGPIANFPRQNSYPGFPMALMYEEVMILLEENICKLFEYTNFHKAPSESLSKLVEETESRIFYEQSECMKEKRIEQLSSKIDMIANGKRKKMAKDGNFSVCDKESLLQEEINKLPPLSIGNSLVQIPTEHPWPHELKEVNIDELLPTVNSETSAIRCKVYKDLWKKGFFVTGGTKFGADFLVYLGDPVKFHAMYMVKCLKSFSENIAMQKLVAYGRLGVSVNKLTVLAYLKDNDNIAYQTLQWHDVLS